MSRYAKEIVTNGVKLGLGARNTNVRRYTVLQRFDKLGIGYASSAKLPAQASKVRKENRPQTQKQKRNQVPNKKTARKQESKTQRANA